MANPKLARPAKANGNQAAFEISVQPPQVKVGAPQVQVDVPAPQITMDTTQMAEAFNQLAIQMNQILTGIAQAMARHDERLVQVAAEQQRLLKAIAMKDNPAPVVKLPPRPRSFTVEMEGEDGEPVYMNIEANSPN